MPEGAFALGSLSQRQPPALPVGKAEHKPYQKKPPKEQPFQLLVDIQAKMAEGKGEGYKKWTTKFNLKEMSKTLLFLQEQKIGSAEELRERAAAATERYHAMGDSIKAAEARLTEIAVLKNHIINYAKTREVYAAYRKAGYSKKFLDAHREEITLHKAAKTAFDEAGLQKLPKVKELDAEFAELLTKKKVAYPDYRKAREEMQPLLRAQKNVELFFAEEKTGQKQLQAGKENRRGSSLLERGLGGFFLCHIAKNGQLLPAQKGISAPPHGTRWRIVRPHPAAQLPGCAARCLQQRYIRVWEKSQQAFCSAK